MYGDVGRASEKLNGWIGSGAIREKMWAKPTSAASPALFLYNHPTPTYQPHSTPPTRAQLSFQPTFNSSLVSPGIKIEKTWDWQTVEHNLFRMHYRLKKYDDETLMGGGFSKLSVSDRWMSEYSIFWWNSMSSVCQAWIVFLNLSQFQTYLGLDAGSQGENQGSNVAEDCVPGKDKDKRCEENWGEIGLHSCFSITGCWYFSLMSAIICKQPQNWKENGGGIFH